MVVRVGRGALDREAAKAVLAGDGRRGLLERGASERPRKGELVAASKWGVGLVIRSYEIAIAPRRGAIASMKLRTHLEGRGHPDIGWQHRVHGPPKLRGFPSRRDGHADRLPARMHTRIRSA